MNLASKAAEVNLGSKDHIVITMAVKSDYGVVAKDYVIMGNHWKHLISGSYLKRKIIVLPIEDYIEHRKNGADLDDIRSWKKLYLCLHWYISDCLDCVYCEALVLCPDIELQEIETAILEASGSYEERVQSVLDEFRCKGTKPAKR